ncbi:hypothetical protein M918_24590 [Clostridium sp. BL8]|uniref:IS91 family transposase n=2 Tax=Clostridium TaxID=1485 RepID=UPI00038A0E14|nr:IS91 family transposase [Clostridium sp. BL8]EQB88360.1 hypothetical protein M918_24590 [Clostridium sp. BL8]
MMNCGSLNNGFIEFICEACGKTKRLGFTCKSRFCNSCGKVRVDNWTEDLIAKLINTPHRHMVFTIPKELREYFRADRRLLSLLPQCATEAISSWYLERSKKEKFTPGIVAVIHTFGRDLKWNPHVHLLVTEGASGNITAWKKFNFMPFAMLRNRWQKLILDKLGNNLKNGIKEYKRLKNQLYSVLTKGFYVYAKGLITSTKIVARYVGRYAARPVIAQSRIISYDGRTVRFYYERHEDGKRIEVELDAIDFIKKLIIHIPEKHFRMIRYYGIYSSNNKCENKFFKLINEKVAEELKKLRKWEYRILKYFGIDPLKCEKCKKYMVINRIYHPKYGDIRDYYYNKIKDEVKQKINEIKEMHAAVKRATCGKIEPVFK